MNTIRYSGVVLLFAVATCATAQTAMDGAPGAAAFPASAVSAGKVSVSLHIPDVVRMTKVRDIYLDNRDKNAVKAGSELCLSRNAAGTWALVAHSINGGKDFLFQDADHHTIAYEVAWNDGHGEHALAAGQITNITRSTPRPGTECGGGSSAHITVAARNKTANKTAKPGFYSDLLVLTIQSQ